ncbi:MAG: N-acetylneuraminate lyase [Gemmataceae bacterium]|nr:N-acetylneuraminate lyase [Gemmataceae bacterium]
MSTKLVGLIAATHTPFNASGGLNLDAIEKQAAYLLRTGVKSVFVCGSTGESHSLTVEERLAVAQRWSEVIRGTPMRLVVHVGSNCIADARTLAAQAQTLGASAIAALSPSYFKPRTLDLLIDCCAEIASAAPGLPYYFYDIPIMTNVHYSMPEFLEIGAARIPTLAGLKFTNPDLMAYQSLLRVAGGRFDIPWGTDEYLLAALSLGAVGAVGSTYNFAGPIYNRVIAAFAKGDLVAARAEQYRSVQMIELLASLGFMGAAKSVMELLGVPVGPPRLPHARLTPGQHEKLKAGLASLGFFDWVA